MKVTLKLTYKQLQSALKQFRNEGKTVKCPLTSKQFILEHEYARLTAEAQKEVVVEAASPARQTREILMTVGNGLYIYQDGRLYRESKAVHKNTYKLLEVTAKEVWNHYKDIEFKVHSSKKKLIKELCQSV
jgi:hypothetical protein